MSPFIEHITEPDEEQRAEGYEAYSTKWRRGDPCNTYAWIGQDFAWCDKCGRPCWEHLYEPGMGKNAGLRRRILEEHARKIWLRWGSPKGIEFHPPISHEPKVIEADQKATANVNYRRRSSQVEAIQFLPGLNGNCRKVSDFLGENPDEILVCNDKCTQEICGDVVFEIYNEMSSTILEVQSGNWIVKEILDDGMVYYYPVHSQVFEQLYDAL